MISTFHSEFKVWLLSVPDSKLICQSPIHPVFPLLSTFIHSTSLWYRLYFHSYFHLHWVSSIFTAHPLSTSPPLRTLTAFHFWHRKVTTWIMWRPNYNISEIMEIFRGPILWILIQFKLPYTIQEGWTSLCPYTVQIVPLVLNLGGTWPI